MRLQYRSRVCEQTGRNPIGVPLPGAVRMRLTVIALLFAANTFAGAGRLEFEPNRGQADASVKFLGRGQDCLLLFTPTEVLVHKDRRVTRIPVPGKGRARIEGVGPLSGRTNYFIGSDPAKWRTGIPHFAQVRYRGVYPGKDLVFSAVGERLEGVVNSAAGQPRQLAYVTYLGGSRADRGQAIAVDIAGNAYVTGTTSSADFPVTPGAAQNRYPDAYNVAFVTKLAPDGASVVYSTYLGATPSASGMPQATGYGIAVDAGGNAYVSGITSVWGFSTTPGALRFDGATGFVAKLSPTGDSLVYSAEVPAAPQALALDSAGNVYLTGWASGGLPTTTGAVQQRVAGNDCMGKYGGPRFPCPDAFVAKVNPTGSAFVYATYLGGSENEVAYAIAVDDAGYAHITGETTSDDFPTTLGAIQRTFHGRILLGPVSYGDGFVAKLNPQGTALVYSTYLGGTEGDSGRGIALDRQGNAYVSGWTESGDFPTTAGVLRTACSGRSQAVPPGSSREGFLAKLNVIGQLTYSTCLGGLGADAAAVDAGGNAYVTGNGVSVVNADATALLHSTSIIGGAAIALDRSGAAYLTGPAAPRPFFATPGAFQTAYRGGDSDAFVAKIDFSAPVGVQPLSIVNAASFEPGHPLSPIGTVAPGELVSIFGLNLGPSNGIAAQLTQSSIGGELAGTRVLFDGVAAPLLYVQANQINAVVPFAVKQPSTRVVVETPAGSYGPVELPVDPAVPGMFASAILNEDGTLNSPSNPAARGSVIVFYATGAGMMVPGMAEGSIAPLTLPLPRLALGVSVLIGGQQAGIEYAGAAPGLVAGVIQMNVRVPQNAPAGDRVFISLHIGNYQSQFNTTVALR